MVCRILHCHFFIDFCLRATYLLSCLRRILYLLWEAFPRRHLGQVLDPAQAKFVVCDYTIENGLPYRRDATILEDYCQVHKRVAPRILAVLNSCSLALLDFLGVRNVPMHMLVFDTHRLLAVRLLLGSLLTFT